MKNILFLRSNPVNPDSRVEKEVEALCEVGYNVNIFCWDRSNNYPVRISILKIGKFEIPIYKVGIKAEYGKGLANLSPNLQFQRAIKHFLIENSKNYDFVHACDFDTAYTAFSFINKRKKIKFIYDIFDFYVDAFNVPNIIKPIILSKDIEIIDNADATIICTEKRKEQIAGSHPKKLVVIHNAPPTIKTKPDRVFDGIIRVAYFGILSGGRLIEELIQAVSNRAQFELHIGGFGYLEEKVQSAANKYSNIIYYGKVPYSTVLHIELNCDVLTAIYDPSVPNHKYAAPNKFYEGLMLGKPLIMCRNTGMSEVVADNNFGVLIDYNLKSLESGLEEVSKNFYL